MEEMTQKKYMGGEKKKKEQEKEGKFCTIQIQVRAQQEA